MSDKTIRTEVLEHATLQWQQVTDSVAAVTGSPDEQAVLGAKTSRSYRVYKKWKQLANEEASVVDFLDKNYGEYGHGSIGEMANVFVHIENIGWPFAWFFEDHPLFVGQETSTRAVDVANLPRPQTSFFDKEDLDTKVETLHQGLLALYRKHMDTLKGSGGYKYDQVRYLLPGSISTAVTYVNDVRVGLRHLAQMKEILGTTSHLQALFEDVEKGFEACAPRASLNAGRNPRKAMRLWDWREHHLTSRGDLTHTQFSPFEEVTLRRHNIGGLSGTAPMDLPGRTKLEYLDPAWAHFDVFDLEITCSVAAARDWHRHRAVMPWKVQIYTKKTDKGNSFVPHASLLDLEDRAQLDSLYCQAYSVWKEAKDKDPLPAMHAIPFGAMVRMSCRATLPALLYMLELRAASEGANAEYAHQGKLGLYLLHKSLSDQINSRVQPLMCFGSASEYVAFERAVG